MKKSNGRHTKRDKRSPAELKQLHALAAYFDARKDVDFIGAAEPGTTVWVEVPKPLLPEVRRLLFKHTRSASTSK